MNDRLCLSSFIALIMIIVVISSVRAEEPLKIVYNMGVAPIKFEDDLKQPAGLFPDLWRLWSEKTGRKIQFIKAESFDESLDLIKSGQADLHAGLFKTGEREEFLDYSTPVLELEYYLYTHPSIKTISDINNASGLIIGIQAGGFTENWVRERVPAERIAVYPSFNKLFDAAVKGEIKVFVSTRISLMYYLSQNRLTNIFSCDRRKPLYSQVYYTAALKGKRTLIETVNRGLALVSREEREQLENKWIVRSHRDIPTEFAALLDEEELSFLTKTKTLRVHNEKDWAPFNFNVNGVPKGFSIDYMDLLAQKCGLEIKYVTGPSWNEFLEMTKTGELDVMLNIARSPERQEYLAFTTSYITMTQVLYTRRDFPLVTSIEDLYEKRFALPRGFYLQDILKKYPQVRIIEVADTSEAIYAVSTGKADALFDLMPVVNYLTKRLQITNLKVGGDMGIVEGKPIPLHIAVSKNHPLLARILEKGMNNITENEINALRNRWMPPTTPSKEALPEVILTPQERRWLRAHKTLKLGNGLSGPPFAFLDSDKRFAGIASGYMEIISERLGIEFQPLADMNSTKVMEKIKTGEIDVIPAATRTEEHAAFLNFTKPYMSLPIVIATRKEGLFIDNLDDLTGIEAGVLEGCITQEILTRDYPKLILIPFQSLADGLASLSKGKTGAFIGNLGSITFEIERQNLDRIKIAAPTKYSYDLSFGVRKDLPQLVDILNKTLDTIDERKRTAIKNTWMAIEVKYGIDFKTIVFWITPFAVGALFIISLVLAWNRQLGREVARRKMAEMEYLASERKVSAMSQAVNDALIMIDCQGKVRFWNQAAEMLFGYSAEEAVGLDVHDIAAPANLRLKAKAGVGEFARTGRGVVFETNLETTAVNRNNVEFPVEVSLSAFQVDEDWFAVGTVRDITERKKAEEDLRESEERVRKIVDSINTGIIIVDPDNRTIVDANPVATKMIGKERENVIGMECHHFICSAEKNECPILDQGKRIDNAERVLLNVEGKRIPVLKTVVPVILSGKTFLLESFVDITERKHAEDEIRQYLEDLERFNKLVIGREEKMIQLKAEINKLLVERGQEVKYKIVE